MFSIKIDKLDPLLDAISLFTDIVNDKICLKFSLSTFSIIARYQHPFFFAMLFIPEPLFAEYFVGRDHILRVSLLSLHTALARGQTYSSLRIHLQEEQNIICLAFEPSRHSPVPMRRKMRFEVPMEDWSAGEIDFDAKSFSIESDLFRDIITTFYDYNEVDTILITSVGSKVSFSVLNPFHEVIITEENGECLILGDRQVVSEMHMPLHPSSFFLNFPYEARRVWFFKSNDSYAIIKFPFHVHPHFLMVRFPALQELD